MKSFCKLIRIILVATVLMTCGVSCKDDLSWQTEIEQIRQEISQIKALLEEIQKQKTITEVVKLADGYEICFSDGKKIKVTDGKDAPSITNVVETEDTFIFYFNDGSSIESRKYCSLVHVMKEANKSRTRVFMKDFTDTTQLMWMFERNLLNKLMTPAICMEIKNGAYDYENGRTIISQKGTDWISPYILYAVNDADGDFSKAEHSYFTGGFHGYANASSGVSPTARCIEVKVYCDGKEIADNEICDCKTVKLVWKNLIQASNTEKEDGSGREVIEEVISCTLDWHKILDVTIETIALEDVEITHHYGLQCSNMDFKGKVIYPGTKTGAYDYDQVSKAPSVDCHSIMFVNKSYQFKICADDDFRYNLLKGNTANVFYTNVKKSYFYAVYASKSEAVRLNKGQSICFHGSYCAGRINQFLED